MFGVNEVHCFGLKRGAQGKYLMCIVQAHCHGAQGEIETSPGWHFMSLILACCWSRIAEVTVYLWPRGYRSRTPPQMSQPNSWEGRTQVRQFLWNRELFVKLGVDKSGTQWAASQNSNSEIGGSLPKRRKHGFAF